VSEVHDPSDNLLVVVRSNTRTTRIPQKPASKAPCSFSALSERALEPYEFIHEHIDSVPQLEALILLWNSRPVGWTAEELSSRLYVPVEQVYEITRDLLRLELAQEIAGPGQKFAYFPHSSEQDDLMRQVDDAYRHDLVRISTMIHAKASSPVREFARAFRIRKDRDA
jgi:hypothetical protein